MERAEGTVGRPGESRAGRGTAPEHQPRRRGLRVLFAVGSLLVVAEAGSYAALAVLTGRFPDMRRTPAIYAEQTKMFGRLIEGGAEVREEPDALLGWRYRPGYRDAANTIGAQGLRGARRYARKPPPGVVRVAAFGDSFVYADEVADAEAWCAQMEAAHPQLEVLNYGVGGYGVDQALLRYEAEGATLHPQVVVMGFATPNLRRVVNVYRRFMTTREGPWIKPRFVLDDAGALQLVPAPASSAEAFERYMTEPAAVRELGGHDQWYEPLVYENPVYDWSAAVRLLTGVWTRVDNRYLDPDRLLDDGQFNPESAAFRIQLALFRRFAETARTEGRMPLVVLLPTHADVERVRAGGRPVYAPLADALAREGLPYTDLVTTFRTASAPAGAGIWFAPGGHYSAAGNAVVAEHVAQVVLEQTEELGTADKHG